MCVILYKPTGIKMPSRTDLKACFKHNPDGAGFMLPLDNKVIIHKGFMKYEDFEKDLIKTVKDNKVDPIATPIVCHFRISTQGGVNKALCHPFPICEDYDEMRKLDNICDIGLAHNGIISLTSESDYSFGHWDNAKQKWFKSSKGTLDYNDTMTFIKDYASLIIDNDLYFARNDRKCRLLEKLIGYSKLAIMNKKGFVKLIGEFYKRGGVYYSNLHSFPREDKANVNFNIDEKYY